MNTNSRGNNKRMTVLTGACQKNGMELARRLAENQFDLIVADEEEGVFSIPKKLEIHPVRVEAIRVCLATREGVETLYEKIKRSSLPVSSIVISADGCCFETSGNIQEEMLFIRHNILSSVHLSKLLLKDMVHRNKGQILFTSFSDAAQSPIQAIRHASQAFLTSFADEVKKELKGTNVRVSSLFQDSGVANQCFESITRNPQ